MYHDRDELLAFARLGRLPRRRPSAAASARSPARPALALAAAPAAARPTRALPAPAQPARSISTSTSNSSSPSARRAGGDALQSGHETDRSAASAAGRSLIAEPLAQTRQHVGAEAAQEPLLVVAGRVEDQVARSRARRTARSSRRPRRDRRRQMNREGARSRILSAACSISIGSSIPDFSSGVSASGAQNAQASCACSHVVVVADLDLDELVDRAGVTAGGLGALGRLASSSS